MDIDWLIITGFMGGVGAGFALGWLVAWWLSAQSGSSTTTRE